MVAHARVIGQNERAARARRLYQRGLDRLEGRWANTGPDGARFLAGHPYARDLDLFGPASLFQLLHTVRTEAGEDTLAGWLGGAAAVSEIARVRRPSPSCGRVSISERTLRCSPPRRTSARQRRSRPGPRRHQRA